MKIKERFILNKKKYILFIVFGIFLVLFSIFTVNIWVDQIKTEESKEYIIVKKVQYNDLYFYILRSPDDKYIQHKPDNINDFNLNKEGDYVKDIIPGYTPLYILISLIFNTAFAGVYLGLWMIEIMKPLIK